MWRRRRHMFRDAQFNDAGHEREHLCLSYLYYHQPHDLIICSNAGDCWNHARF